jgi:hypothetical protein
MSINFYVWEEHWQTGRRHRVSLESWPGPYQEAADEVTAFAVEYVLRWKDDPDFPDHPCRDKDGNIVLPKTLDVHPFDYVESNMTAAPPAAEPPLLPFSGPMTIVASPINNDIKATYERSRRGLGRTIQIKPAPAPYEPPTSPVSSHTPSTPPSPPIAPRFFEADRQHPKYGRTGTRR